VCGCSAPPVILPESPQLCQNSGLSVFIFNRGNREKSRGQVRRVEWVGDDSHVVFGQTFPCEKGSVRQCIVVMQ
jgi:hypothetical protein